MSLNVSLTKQKNQGVIDFIEMRADITRKHKQFLVRDIKTNKYSIIFYDNKYRQDTLNRDTYLLEVESNLSDAKDGLDDIGVYNTKEDYIYYNKLSEFLLK